jgi:uncharacterized membrane protein
MSIYDLLDCLRRRLSARGVPRDYLRDLLDELEDHFRQSIAAGRSEAESLAALGDEETIVETTLNSLRRDSWLGRNQIACLIVAPILLYPIVLALAVLPLAMLGLWLSKHTAIPHTGWVFHLWRGATESVSNLAFPIFCFWLLAKASRKFFCGRSFMLFACGEIIVWSLVTMTTIRLPSTPHAHGQFMLGVGIAWPVANGYKQILLAIYATSLLWWLFRHWQRNLQLA